MPVTGANRKKKYLRLLLLLILAGVVCGAYLVYSSGILADDNSRIPRQLITRINLERQANNLAPVQQDDRLADLALAASREAKLLSSAYATGSRAVRDDSTSIFVIPKISWAISGYDAQQQMLDALENENNAFRSNVLNGEYRNAGIGVTSDGYNYYIAVNWQ